jgi:hypothetical protein
MFRKDENKTFQNRVMERSKINKLHSSVRFGFLNLIKRGGSDGGRELNR